MAKFAGIPVIFLMEDTTFSHWHEFEKFLSEALAAKNMEAMNVSVEGSPFRIIGLKSKPALPIEIPKQDEKGPQEKLKQMVSKTEAKKGKMLWSKGYLKK